MSLFSPPAASAAAVASFIVLVAAVAVVAVAAVRVASRAAGNDSWRRTAGFTAALLAWLAVTWLAAASGLLAIFDRMPPPLLPLMGVTWLLSTALAFSSLGTVLARELPVAALVGFQSFRVPLELILHRLGRDGVLPVQMTYDGMNFDILTGLSAIVLALWASYGRPPRAVVAAWNAAGLLLLLVIVTIAVLSAPLPFRVFMNEPANTIVTTTPFVWLPTVLVQAAWIGHLLLFRRLKM